MRRRATIRFALRLAVTGRREEARALLHECSLDISRDGRGRFCVHHHRPRRRYPKQERSDHA